MKIKSTPSFSLFTGYSKGLQPVISVIHDTTNEITRFTLKKSEQLDIRLHDNIQLDGVLTVITALDDTTITATTTDELIANTTLSSLSENDLVSVGLCSLVEPESNRGYQLQASSQGTVTFLKSQTQPEHEHTLQLDFECDTSLEKFVKNDKHIGLAGSSLTVRNIEIAKEGKMRFSIFCGRDTRELTCFNAELKMGAQINITEPVSPSL